LVVACSSSAGSKQCPSRAMWWVPSMRGEGRGGEEENSFQRVTTKRGDHARHQPSGARAWHAAKRKQRRPSTTYPKDMVIRAVLPTLRSLGLGGVSVMTHTQETPEKRKDATRTIAAPGHCRRGSSWHAMGRRTRAGHRRQSTQLVCGNTLNAPRTMA
jgi:hypothetical protein